MKRCRLPLVALFAAVITVGGGRASAVLVGAGTTGAITLKASCYYTWGIDPVDVDIPDGFIITDAVVTLHGASTIPDKSPGALVVYVLDNPPIGFCENTDMPSVDHFAAHGCRLRPDYVDTTLGDQTLTLRPSALSDPASWVWRIYGRPFSCQLADGKTVSFSSALLELVDYVGNATPFGIGLDPDDRTDFAIRGLSLTLTLQRFTGSPEKKQLTLTFGSTNNPPVLSMPPQRVVSEGTPLSLTFQASDPDGDPVSLRCSGLPPGAVFAGGVFSWTPSFDTASRGSAVPFALTITADDGALSTSQAFVIWVFNTNRPPVLGGLTLVSVEGGTLLTYRINAADPDGDTLGCQAVQLPAGASFDPQTQTIHWDTTAVAAGAYNATIIVSDGLLSSTQTFTLNTSAVERTERLTSVQLR